MPTLKFKGKEFIYSHHLSVPFRPLQVDVDKSLPLEGKAASLDDNLIIQGDNLEGLKALLPVYAGKVDCIYIDPPYNTGTEGWCYNDRVNSPLMREWLKKANNPVDLEDMERHDKWLCMMWPRLQLLRELLAETGVIFVSIDDNEQAHLKLVMDEIFGKEHFLGNITRATGQTTGQDSGGLGSSFDFILVYSKDTEIDLSGLPLTPHDLKRFDNEDERGMYAYDQMRKTGANDRRIDRPNMYYPVKNPDGIDVFPIAPAGYEGCWRFGKSTYEKLNEENYILWKKTKRDNEEIWWPYVKYYLEGRTKRPSPLWNDLDGNKKATRDLRDMFDGEKTLDFPKPVDVIKRCIQISPNQHEDFIILDSFAGSGTTAQAVLELNKQDGGKRKFILIECEDYADTITAERTRRVINGYEFTGTDKQELLKENITFSQLKKADELLKKVETIETQQGDNFDKISKTVKDGVLIVTGETKVKDKKQGIGGSFTYATLGEAIDLDNMLKGTVPSFSDLAQYVFYTATGLSLDESKLSPEHFYIGESVNHRVYLIYQATADFLRSEEAALNIDKLNIILKHHQQQTENKNCLIFAAAKYMGQNSLLEKGVEFCQLPYAIHKLEGER